MVILGIATPFTHDPSAALLIDGKIVALCDEERLIREKHARERRPVNAVKFCLKKAGIKPEDVNAVAYPWSFEAYQEKKWEFVKRCWKTRPAHAYKSVVRAKRFYQDKIEKLRNTLREAGIVFDGMCQRDLPTELHACQYNRSKFRACRVKRCRIACRSRPKN